MWFAVYRSRCVAGRGNGGASEDWASTMDDGDECRQASWVRGCDGGGDRSGDDGEVGVLDSKGTSA